MTCSSSQHSSCSRGFAGARRREPHFRAHLGARPRSCWPAGDIDAYRLLFAHATRLEDPSRRYHARVVLLECGLAAAVSTSSVPAAAVLMAVADTAVEVLESANRVSRWWLNCAAKRYASSGTSIPRWPCSKRTQRLDALSPRLGNRTSLRYGAAIRGRPGARSVPTGAFEPLAARHRRRPASAPGRWVDAEPVHDRPRRGGDAPSLPGGHSSGR